MKNILISIVLGVFISSCSQAKYGNLDSQFANSGSPSIAAKYNTKNCVNAHKRKRQLVRQIALSTQE